MHYLFLFTMSLLIKAVACHAEPTILKAVQQEIDVNGKKAVVFNIIQQNGTTGLTRIEGEKFNVLLENHTSQPTCVHWHGLILPNSQDGIPYVTQAPILPGEKYYYNFNIVQQGTYWMHSHYRFQEQQLLSAPLIIYQNEDEAKNANQVVMFIEDFTFQNPEAIFANLKANAAKMPAMPMKRDLNDVTFDAFLTNRKTLQQPDIVAVKPGQEIRLRVINGSAATNFYVHTGSLKGRAIAVDGQAILPLEDTEFLLATAERVDILVTIPKEGGVFPILAKGEGTAMQTGLILVTSDALIPKLSEKNQETTGAFNYLQEKKLQALTPLASKPVDRTLLVNLEGNMAKYIWMINGEAWPNTTPLIVKQGERVEIIFDNKTEMEHPMHLHGHFFQVTEIDGVTVSGAKRDTILVLPKTKLKVQFDADNPGIWMLHCHNLYHMHAGMMTTINYEGYPLPPYTKQQQLEAN